MRHIDFTVTWAPRYLVYNVVGRYKDKVYEYLCEEENIEMVKDIIRGILCPKPLPILIGGELL